MTTATTPAGREASPVTVQANLARVVMETITTTALARVASLALEALESQARATTPKMTGRPPNLNMTTPGPVEMNGLAMMEDGSMELRLDGMEMMTTPTASLASLLAEALASLERDLTVTMAGLHLHQKMTGQALLL